MSTTPEQEKQVKDFLQSFIDEINWLKEPEGLDMLDDKARLDDGTISEAYLCQLMIMYAMDKMSALGLREKSLHDNVAGAVLQWSMQSLDQQDRDALRPIYEKFLNG